MRLRTAALVLALGPIVFSAPLRAQDAVDSLETAFPVEPRAASVPFGPGERLVYHVKVGIFGAGEGSLEVVGVDSVRGHPSYHVRMQIDGGLMGLSVHDKYDSWFGVRTLTSRRFIQDINDPGYSSFRHYEMFPERRTWERQDNDEFGPLGSPLPLDDISFVYYIRTLPLEVGKTYTLPRYFKEEGNPVIVKVLRKDHRKTDAGEFNTIVVKPIIRTKGLFGQGGDAEIHFTDDDRRIVVYMKSNIPKFPGSLTLHLEEVREGLPLNPEARARTLERWKERDDAQEGPGS